MLPALRSLIDLQAVESRADDAKRRIAAAPGRIAALDARLAGARRGLEEAKAALAANQAARREQEKELFSVQQRVAKYKDQLTVVKTNREFHALQHEIETFGAEASRIEGVILEGMIEADACTAAVKAAETRLAADEQGVRTEREAIEQEVTAMRAVVATCTTERAAIVRDVDAGIVAQIDRLFQARKGVAITTFVDGHCTACRVGLRPHLAVQVRRNDSIVQCESCQRIIYFVPPVAPEGTESPS